MAGGFGQYLQETRTELNHVAWPTRAQTIVYTSLVAALSIGVALYLGFFDYIFTGFLSRTVASTPHTSQPNGGLEVTQTPATTTTTTEGTPSFNIGTSSR